MKIKLLKNSFFYLLGLSFSVFAQNSDKYLQEKLNKIQTMQASFLQVIKSKNAEQIKSSGDMALAKPKYFYWKTLKPMPQLFIADGQNLWIYDKDLEQVSVRKQEKNLSGAAAIFLKNSNNNLAKDYYVDFTKSKREERFNLRPKTNQMSFARIGLVFVGDTIKQINLYDELGQHTEVLFTNVRLNSKLAPNLFKFQIPKGIDVVHQ